MPADKTARLPRRAVVTANRRLTPTETVLVSFRVVDDVERIRARFTAPDAASPFAAARELLGAHGR